MGAFTRRAPLFRTEKEDTTHMEIFQHALTQMLMLFFIMLCGFVARKRHMTDDSFDGNLSKLVMTITLPATILNSVLSNPDLPSDEVILKMLAYAAIYFVVVASCAALIMQTVYRRLGRATRGAHAFMMVFGNTGFLGYAVLASVLDQGAVFYAAVFNIVFNIVLFSVGTFLVGGEEGKPEQRRSTSAQFKALARTLVRPVMLASYASVVLALLHINDSGPVGQTCELLGGMTVPAAMLIIGSSLAKMPLREMLFDGWSYLTVAIRLVAAPLGAYLLFGLFVHDSYVLAILVLLAAMPVASNGTMLALAYGGDTRAMARGTFLSTVFSLVTLPMIAFLVV